MRNLFRKPSGTVDFSHPTCSTTCGANLCTTCKHKLPTCEPNLWPPIVPPAAGKRAPTAPKCPLRRQLVLQITTRFESETIDACEKLLRNLFRKPSGTLRHCMKLEPPELETFRNGREIKMYLLALPEPSGKSSETFRNCREMKTQLVGGVFSGAQLVKS